MQAIIALLLNACITKACLPLSAKLATFHYAFRICNRLKLNRVGSYLKKAPRGRFSFRSTTTILVAVFTLFLIPQSAPGQKLADRSTVSSALFRRAPGVDTTEIGTTGGSGRIWVIMGKVGLGGAMGVLFSLAGGSAAVSISSEQGWAQLGPAVLGAISGYILGSALGVHIIAETDNPESRFLPTLGMGFLGMGAGLAVSNLSNGKGIGAGGPIIFPILFEIVYTELAE